MDNMVEDGEAIGSANLAVWIREEDPDVKMVFNFNSSFFKIAETVGVWELRKDPMGLWNFL